MAKKMEQNSKLELTGNELKLLYRSFKQAYMVTKTMRGKSTGEKESEAIQQSIKHMEDIGDKMETILQEQYGLDPKEIDSGGMQVPSFLQKIMGGLT